MSESTLARKLKLKPGSHAAVIDAPQGYLAGLEPLPADVSLSEGLRGTFDWVQLFVRNKADLEKTLPRVVKALKPVSQLWISFPKGTSGIQTDLTRDKGWELLDRIDLKWVTLVSVDEVWSAFALRPFKPGEKRTTRGGRDRS
jgi:hypothetical protein